MTENPDTAKVRPNGPGVDTKDTEKRQKSEGQSGGANRFDDRPPSESPDKAKDSEAA